MGKRFSFYIVALIVLLAFPFVWTYVVNEQAKKIDTSYLDTSKTVDERIDILLGQMTLREKIGQMALVEKNSVKDINDVWHYGLGAILSGSGGKPENNTPSGWYEMTTRFHDAAKESRLAIPIFYGADANHGHSNVPGATIFPHAIGLGSTNDEELVSKVAQVTAREILATGVNWTYSPSLDLPKDIRWGRVYEAFGDDPYAVAALGGAFVKGSQSTRAGDVYILATPKHYLGAGSMVWGSSFNKNFKIDQGIVPASEEALRDSYLVPFKKVVDDGALSIMAALSAWGDSKVSANHYLLTEVLKNELGFKGFVVSDWYGVYEITKDDYDSAVLGINAGVDMVMLPFDYKTFIGNVETAVTRGDIAQARIDDAVRRILRAKFEAGLFERATDDLPALELVGNDEHRTLAREAVAKSMVLLKNRSAVLPLNPNLRHLLVAGSGADNAGRQMGAWTVEWQGIDGNWLTGVTSIVQGLREFVGADGQIEYDLLGNFDDATYAPVGIVVVSEKPYAEGWGDTKEPTVSAEDITAITNIQKKADVVIVVIVSGRPLILPEEVGVADAIVAAWLPGSEGAGVADVLFGKEPFTGKLPLPWPKSIGQLPITRDEKAQDGTEFLYPRGFGFKTSPTIF